MSEKKTKIVSCVLGRLPREEEIDTRSHVHFWTHDGKRIIVRITDAEDGVLVMGPNCLAVFPQGLNRIEIKPQ